MPQLDIYILCNLVHWVLFLFTILYLLNTYYILLNIYLALSVRKLKLFVEKRLIFNLWQEVLNITNYKFMAKVNSLILNLFSEIQNNLLIWNLIDDLYIKQNLFLNLNTSKKINYMVKYKIELSRQFFKN